MRHQATKAASLKRRFPCASVNFELVCGLLYSGVEILMFHVFHATTEFYHFTCISNSELTKFCLALIDYEALSHGMDMAKNCPIATEVTAKAFVELTNAINHARFAPTNQPYPIMKH